MFKLEDKAIILEDDCYPSIDFYFCDELLKKYKNSKKVKFITGNCFQNKNFKIKESYYFSKYSHIWGWAAWKSTWKLYKDDDFIINKFLNSKKFNLICKSKKERNYWKLMHEKILDRSLKSWAYYLLISLWIKQYLTITPRQNLVINLGINKNGTNTKYGY